MKSYPKFVRSLAVCAALLLSSAAQASAPLTATEAPRSAAESEAANGMGIITPNVATSVLVFDDFTKFRDTGEFAICADGIDSAVCKAGKYLTPAQFVAKFYPKAKYVGFRLLMSSTSGSDTYLYIYLKKAPQ